MDGLLGTGWDDPKSQGLLALASGMLQGNMGAGVANMNTTMAGAQDKAMQRKLMDMQYQEAALGLTQKQANQARMAAIDGELNSPPPTSQNAIASSPTVLQSDIRGNAPPQGNTPTSTPLSASQSGGLVAQARALGIPDNAIRTDIAFNGGKGISNMIYVRGAPNMKVSNGYAYNENDLKPGFLPQMNTSANGQTSMISIVNGVPVVNAPGGAEKTYGAYRNTEEEAKAKYDFVDMPDGKGGTQKMTREAAVRLLGGKGAGSEIPSTGNMQPSPDQLATIRADVARTGNPNPTINFTQPTAAAAQPSGAPPKWGQSLSQAEQSQIDQKKVTDTSSNKEISKGLAATGLAQVELGRGAPEIVNNAIMIREAISKGAITGTGADLRLSLQKALATAGLVGEGKAASTQALMSSLSKTTLGGVKSSGLGAGNGFTDKDREFLQAAISGTIDSTPANLLRVADLTERVARANYVKGSAVLSRWKSNPALADIAQDTQYDPMPMAQQAKPNAPPAPKNTILKGTVQQGYRFKGGDQGLESNWEKL